MTLVEALVSLVIVFIVFLGLSASGLVVLNENIKNDIRDEAVNVAEQEMTAARRVLFDNLATLPTYSVARQVRGVTKNFNVTRTVAAIGGDPDNRQVTVTVAWTRIENQAVRNYSHQVATIVRR